MKHRTAVMVAALVALGVSMIAAVAVGVTDGDQDRAGHRDGMMSSQLDGRTDRNGDHQERGWQEPGPGMSGWMTMGGMRWRSDYSYLAEMVAHHAEAVSAARQLQRSDRPEMRSFGAAIVASQTAQMDQMQEWLTEWYPDRSGQVDYQPMMRALSGLEGDQLDEAFLQDMVRHHMGAVMMSQQLLIRGAADHPQLEVLARTIRDEQRAEVFRMQRWLRAWGYGSWHHGGCWAPRTR